MQNRYFKIIYGYGESDYLPITHDELIKACILFMDGSGRGFFKKGAVRGQDIMRILPDWHADQGWSKGWKMQPEDFQEIKHLERGYQEIYEVAKAIAERAIRENKKELISRLTLEEAISVMPSEAKFLTKGAKELSDKFNINGDH